MWCVCVSTKRRDTCHVCVFFWKLGCISVATLECAPLYSVFLKIGVNVRENVSDVSAVSGLSGRCSDCGCAACVSVRVFTSQASMMGGRGVGPPHPTGGLALCVGLASVCKKKRNVWNKIRGQDK